METAMQSTHQTTTTTGQTTPAIAIPVSARDTSRQTDLKAFFYDPRKDDYDESEYWRGPVSATATGGDGSSVFPACVTTGIEPAPTSQQPVITRPGVSGDMLAKAGVRHADADEARRSCNMARAGLWIPYRDLNGQPVLDKGAPYGRLRLDAPPVSADGKVQKYHQQAGTGVHVYLPPGLTECYNTAGTGDLVFVEGEFKSLSLVAHGIPAVGMSGFFGFSTKNGDDPNADPVLGDEARTVLSALNPKQLLFVGDSDTAVNHQFAIAAIRFTRMVQPIPVKLPRTPLDAPGKGVDDMAEYLGTGFGDWWRGTVTNAIPLPPDESEADLVVTLFEHEAPCMAGAKTENREQWLHRSARAVEYLRGRHTAKSHRLQELVTGSLGFPAAIVRQAIAGAIKTRKTSTNDVTAKGRPGRDATYAEMADSYAVCIRKDEHLTMRFFQGQWWRWSGNCWRPYPSADLESAVMGHLRRNFPDSAATFTVSNVIGNLAADNLCGLPSDLKVPFFISTGKSASGWLPMKNTSVNLPELVKALQGEPIPLETVYRDNSPDLFAPFGTDYEYAPDATCPQWEKYLCEVQPNPEAREVMQMLFGLALVPDTGYEVFFQFFGEGGCGKTQCLDVLRALVGSANVCCLPLASFDNRFSTWMLTSHLLNIVGELPTDDGRGSIAHTEGMLKDVASGGNVPTEHKHQKPGTAPAIARCIFAGNSIPTFTDRSNGIWDRLRILPFNVNFRNAPNRIIKIGELIAATELSGIFNWAVEGLAKLRRLRQFPEHPEGMAIKKQHRERCDAELVFLTTEYERGEPDVFIEAKLLYWQFKCWALENGYRTRSEATIANAVMRVFNIAKTRVRTSDGKQPHVYLGLKKIDQETATTTHR